MKPELSIVIPVFNADKVLDELCQKIKEALGSISYEIFLVNDGSKDNSWEKIVELNLKNNRIKGINLSRNFGQHNAIFCGLNYATGEFVLTMDDDLQHPPDEIPKLLNEIKSSDADLVYGIPLEKMHSKFRNTTSKIVQESAQYFDHSDVGKGSSFRIIKRELVRNLILKFNGSYVFIDEIVHWFGPKISFVNVEHHKSTKEKSTYSKAKLFRLYRDIVVNYSAFPLKLMINIGFFFSIVFAGVGFYFLIKKLFFNVAVEGFSALIISILFSSSLIMMSLGMVGKYIFNMYQQMNGKPLYRVKNLVN